MRFAIVGCGLVGLKRLRALRGTHTLAVAADPVVERAQALAAQSRGAVATSDWREAVHDAGVDAV
ncbi:MAG: Gfo/Idh/MocA family oxidoreductase, partial [Bryobacteraceae bacterium]